MMKPLTLISLLILGSVYATTALALPQAPSGTGSPMPTWTVGGSMRPSAWPPGTASPGAWPPGGGPAMGGRPGGGRVPEWVLRIPKNMPKVRIAHAAVMTSAFLLFFPVGGMVLRIWDPRIERYRWTVWIHAALQGVGYVFFTAGAGMGIYIARNVRATNRYHPVLGLSIFALMALQPLTELANHFLFDRYPRVRYVGYVHVWLGRALLVAGLVNGGLGFRFAHEIPGPQWPRWPEIAYGVLALLVGVLYIAVIVVFDRLVGERTASPSPPGADEEEAAEAALGASSGAGADGDAAGVDATGLEGAVASEAEAEAKKAFRSSAL